ncbi:heavy metal-binding domain-containing protein [Pedobacter sp. P351]|uniref:heavy metal-binding domain-containing protein n=1 Tax=Pedobacter superstes TaxID=3133441 RepID=UPI0030B51927
MKKKILTFWTLIAVLMIVSCNNSNRVDASKEAPRERADSVEQDHVEVENKRSTVYTCPKHPEVIKEAPGVCPVCKTTLIESTD